MACKSRGGGGRLDASHAAPKLCCMGVQASGVCIGKGERARAGVRQRQKRCTQLVREAPCPWQPPPLSPTPHQHPTTAARRTALGERETPTISPPPATSFKARRSQLPSVTRYWSTATAIGPGGLQLTCGAGRWAERTVLAQQQAAGADELAVSERATQHGMVSLHCCPAPSCYNLHHI